MGISLSLYVLLILLGFCLKTFVVFLWISVKFWRVFCFDLSHTRPFSHSQMHLFREPEALHFRPHEESRRWRQLPFRDGSNWDVGDAGLFGGGCRQTLIRCSFPAWEPVLERAFSKGQGRRRAAPTGVKVWTLGFCLAADCGGNEESDTDDRPHLQIQQRILSVAALVHNVFIMWSQEIGVCLRRMWPCR